MVEMSNEQLQVFVQTEIAKTLKPLLERVAKAEQHTATLHSFVQKELVDKIMHHVVTKGCASKSEAIKTIQADMLELNNRIAAIRDTLSIGHGLQKNTNEPTPAEYAKFKQARIEAASLKEIVNYTGAK